MGKNEPERMRNPMWQSDPVDLRDYLQHTVCDASARDELAVYLENSYERFMITLEHLPDAPGPVLELGATPYFLTVLMKRFRPGYQLDLANFFGSNVTDSEVVHIQAIDNEKYGESHAVTFRQFNVERQSFPYQDESFAGVLFCEIIEHLTTDPVAALVEIHRVLKPGGWVMITTPNLCFYGNIIKLWWGQNISDAYSGYGAYGRHNREYTLDELRRLLDGVGYRVDRIEARALKRPAKLSLSTQIVRWLRPARIFEEHLFCLARKAGPVCDTRPKWLYRSLPAIEEALNSA